MTIRISEARVFVKGHYEVAYTGKVHIGEHYVQIHVTEEAETFEAFIPHHQITLIDTVGCK